MATKFIERPEGNYSYVAGHGTYCRDAVPHEGYAVAHAVFVDPPPLARGFELIKAYLGGLGRPMAALCGAELRIREPLSFDGFGAFNVTYIALLDSYGLRQNALGTMTRTNVSPEVAAAKPAESSLFGFSFIVPGRRTGNHKTFVSSGSGELAGDGREAIVRLGDTSADGMREKVRWVMHAISSRLPGLGLSMDDVTHANLYCVHPPESYLESEVLSVLGARAGLGVHWHYTRPPILELEFEADLKGVLHEVYL